MDNPSASSLPVTPKAQPTASVKSRLVLALLVSTIFSVMTTAILSWVVLKYTYGGPGIGFIIFVPGTLILTFIGNIVASIVLFIFFRRHTAFRAGLVILGVLNVMAIAWLTIPLLRDFQQRTDKASVYQTQLEKEQALAYTPQDIINCSAITDNYYYWESCVGLSRTVLPWVHTQSESLAICLQQASTKHFAYQPNEPSIVCQQIFGPTVE